MKLHFCFILTFVVFVILRTQTIIKNGQEVYGVWNKKGSPYIIEGEAIVPQGQTLTIKPGVIVQFKEGNVFDYRMNGKLNPFFNAGFLRVNGKIMAFGKKSSKIIFKGKNGVGHWGAVVLVNSNGNVFNYCHFMNSNFIRDVTTDDNATGAISFLNSDGTVKNCIIENGWTGINFKQGSSPVIENCVIYSNEYGLESNSYSNPTVINTIIWNNKNSFYINPGASIKISYSLIQDSQKADYLIDEGKNIYGLNPQLEKNYRVAKGSPCYKKGKNGKNMGLQ